VSCESGDQFRRLPGGGSRDMHGTHLKTISQVVGVSYPPAPHAWPSLLILFGPSVLSMLP